MSHIVSTVSTMRPFIPAKDFEISKRFYLDLGFTLLDTGQDVVELKLGIFSILLQNHFDPLWAENCMLQLLVTDIEGYWQHIESLRLGTKYVVKCPIAPKIQPWGMTVGYVYDPSGVLWHIAQA
ncbi:Glyoxalase-like domain [Yersinia intermedia]|uniref:Glyoxalase-like domain n=1 Tax=Yersinia intermedia TaxID=631 RepID=A0A0H5LX92_YERIN|nr:VOC family protein [Yersinia intermedia]CRY55789.1 Glyoxalase-like domain [Yersinia intermedia]